MANGADLWEKYCAFFNQFNKPRIEWTFFFHTYNEKELYQKIIEVQNSKCINIIKIYAKSGIKSFDWNHSNINTKMKMKNFAKPSPTISTSKPSNESDHESETLQTTLFGCLTINARTALFRRIYLLQMICFPFIPILALFIQNFSIFLLQIHTYNETRYVNQQVGFFFKKKKT